MKKPQVGYQLYSAREQAEKDLRAVLVALKEQGYHGVEFAGFYGHSAQDINNLLSDVGLLPASSHVPLKTMQEDPQGVIAYHAAIGCKYMAVPYVDEHNRPGQSGFAELIPFLYRFGQMCRDAGIQLLYHNHDFEFLKVSGIYGLDFIYDAIPAELLKTQVDTCWVKYAGVDPITYLAQYKGRAPIVHLKDFVSDNTGRTPYALIGLDDDTGVDYSGFSYRPFGHGSQDAEGLVQAAIDAEAQWLVLEQDDPSGASPFEDAQQSMETFIRLGVK